MNFRNKLFSLLVCGCMAGAMIPSVAFAEAVDDGTQVTLGDTGQKAWTQNIEWDKAVDNVGETQYWLQLASEDTEEHHGMNNISIDVPVKVTIAVFSDGTFVTPSAYKNIIENNSEFPVNVKSMAIDSEDDFALVSNSDFINSSVANRYHGNISSVSATNVLDNGNAVAEDTFATKQSVAFTKFGSYSPNEAWAMSGSDSQVKTGDDCLYIQIDGGIKNVKDHYFTQPIQVFNVDYTFEATPATSAEDTSTSPALGTQASITD